MISHAYAEATPVLQYTMRGRLKDKIAIALEGEEVSQHFGHTTQFCVIELEAGKANLTGNIPL